MNEILSTIRFLEESIDKDLKQNNNPSDEKLLDLVYQIEGLEVTNLKERDVFLQHTGYVKNVAIYLLRKTFLAEYEDVYWRTMLAETPYHFESYILYLEKNREFKKKFYEPRQETLKIVVQDLQDLEDRLLIFLGVSLPPRVGKSTLCIFFLTWIACKRPNSHNGMGSYNDTIAGDFHKELLSIMRSPEYTFKEIYDYMNPNCEMILETEAKNHKIVMDKPDRFGTLTCRGYEGAWTGAVDISADGYLYVDDLIKNREQSLSPTRMEKTFQDYLNNMTDRKNDGSRELMVGTLWNVLDPLERIRKKYENDPRYRFRKIPALNELGESNFQYKVGGFSTEFYQKMKNDLDKPEWEAKYQQQPFVREGLLFGADELTYFDGVLPEGDYEPISVVDVALGGGDYLAMPVCMRNKETKVGYVVDFLYDKSTKEVTEPRIIQKVREHNIGKIRFEKNAGGGLYKESLEQKLKDEKIVCLVTDVSAPNNMKKEEKIEYYAKEIKDLVFLSPKVASNEQKLVDKTYGVVRYTRNEDYTMAMDDLLRFVTVGKNIHDDSADSLAQLVAFMNDTTTKEARVIKSPF